MSASKSKVAIIATALLFASPQCKSDDDPTMDAGDSSAAGGTGGASNSGGDRGTGGKVFQLGTGGVSPWVDAGPLCVANLPNDVARVETNSAAGIANCTLVLQQPPNTLYNVTLFANCQPIPSNSTDGGLNWAYSFTEHEVTFSAAFCGSLETDPAQRLDVVFNYIQLP